MFAASTQPQPSYREWDFNGDGQTDSTGETPQFLYKTNGFHSVTLKINGPGCQDSVTKKDYIHIGGCPT
jgi:PKD repeat protein